MGELIETCLWLDTGVDGAGRGGLMLGSIGGVVFDVTVGVVGIPGDEALVVFDRNEGKGDGAPRAPDARGELLGDSCILAVASLSASAASSWVTISGCSSFASSIIVKEWLDFVDFMLIVFSDMTYKLL